MSINPVSKHTHTPHEYFYLFILYYLLKSKDTDILSQWISEKDIPGGVTFFRGPHEIPTHLISMKYKDDIRDFKRVCEHVNGIPINKADAAYYFNITPRIPVAVLFWEGDDEFPPESKIMYDISITQHLTSDIVFALAIEICTRIGSTIEII